MPKFRVRVREVRIHELIVDDAADETEACEIAEDMDASQSTSDMHDEWKPMDAMEIDR